jgi:hypothetical protein
MARLKDRFHHIPGGFQMLLPETGQSAPFAGSFNYVCEQTLTLIQANPWLAERHGWPVTMAGVEAMVEAYCVALCLAGGYTDWLIMDDPSPAVSSYMAPATQKKRQAHVVGVAKNVAAGVKLLLDWLGPSARAVAPELAEKRAAVCLHCPLNGKTGLLEYFTEAAAKVIQTQLQMRTDMSLKTSVDDKLGTCQACTCHLPLKVHVPIEFIVSHTSDEVRKALHPSCWILSESKP